MLRWLCIFGKNSKAKEENLKKFFLKIEYIDEIKIWENLTVKEIEAILCFCILAKIWIFKMATIFGQKKYFWKLGRVYCLDTLWVENFDEVALSLTVKEIKTYLCFCIFDENSKIQNGHHFWKEENVFKIGWSILIRYPKGWKFRRNRSISNGSGDRSNFVFLHFWRKFENSKWVTFLDRRKIFENWAGCIAYIPYG